MRRRTATKRRSEKLSCQRQQPRLPRAAWPCGGPACISGAEVPRWSIAKWAPAPGGAGTKLATQPSARGPELECEQNACKGPSIPAPGGAERRSGIGAMPRDRGCAGDSRGCPADHPHPCAGKPGTQADLAAQALGQFCCISQRAGSTAVEAANRSLGHPPAACCGARKPCLVRANSLRNGGLRPLAARGAEHLELACLFP